MIALRLRNENGLLREAVFKELPVRIGRGTDNDFVLLDNSVSKAHAVVEHDAASGEIVLRDLGSRNGIRSGQAAAANLPVHGSLRCFIGLADMEIEVISNEVTRVIKVNEWTSFNRRRSLPDHLRIVGLAALGWLTYVALQPTIWSPVNENREVTLMWQLIGACFMLPCLAFAWLLVLRTVGRKLRIADTLHAFMRIVWAYTGVSAVLILIYYPLAGNIFGWAHSIGVGCTAAWSLSLLAALRRTTPSRVFRWRWVLGTLGILALLNAALLFAERRHGEPQTDYLVLPPIAGYVGYRIDLDNYLRGITEAAARADQDAAKTSRQRSRDAGTTPTNVQ